MARTKAATPQAALHIAMKAYEDALIRGLCREGALEAALGAVNGVSREDLLLELERAQATSDDPPAHRDTAPPRPAHPR